MPWEVLRYVRLQKRDSDNGWVVFRGGRNAALIAKFVIGKKGLRGSCGTVNVLYPRTAIVWFVL